MGNLGLSMLNKDAANHVQLDCGDRLLSTSRGWRRSGTFRLDNVHETADL